MTIIDLEKQREARRDAAFDEFLAWQDRLLAQAQRGLELLTPLVEQFLAEEKLIPCGAQCEAPRGQRRRTTFHAVRGRTPDVPAVLIPLCTNHLCAVQRGRIRVEANADDTLSWHFRPAGASPVDVRAPRRRGRRRAPASVRQRHCARLIGTEKSSRRGSVCPSAVKRDTGPP